MNMTDSPQTNDNHRLFSLPSKELPSTVIYIMPNDPAPAKNILDKIYPQQYCTRYKKLKKLKEVSPRPFPKRGRNVQNYALIISKLIATDVARV